MIMNTKIEWLPLADVVRGGLNPRTHFDPDKIHELVVSFKEHGFTPALSHLLVRPHPTVDGKWELICGERRWRAATELRMDTVPAVVEAMSDVRVLELQLVENLQREGLSPLEEAEGLRALLAIGDADGKLVHSTKSLAARIGRTEQHISRRLSLCKLVGTMAGDALESGELPLYHAYLLARVPGGKMRDDFTRRVIKPLDGLAPIPYRQLEWMIRDEGMVELRGADFDLLDGNLVAVRLEAGDRMGGGACSDCPRNTKNMDTPGGSKFHMCMNPECFREKRAASHAKWMASVTGEGRRALPFDEAERVFDITGKKLAFNSGLVDLLDAPPDHDLRRGASAPGSWKKLILGMGVPVILAKDGEGKVRELAEHKLVLAAARSAERDHPPELQYFPPERETGREPMEGWERAERDDKRLASTAAAKLKEKADGERAARVTEAQMVAVLDRARGPKVPDEFWSLAVAALLAVTDEHGDADQVAARHGLTGMDGLEKLVKKMPVPDLVAFTVELLLTFYVAEVRPRVLPGWARVFGVDLKSVKKAVDDRIAGEEMAAAQKSEIADGIVWKSRKENVFDFEWNTAGVCVNPDVATLKFPKNVKVAASIEVARSEKGWKVGFELNVSKAGNRMPCSLQSSCYSSRALALKSGLLGLKPLLKAADAVPAVMRRVEEFIAAIADSGKNIGKVMPERMTFQLKVLRLAGGAAFQA